MKQLGIAASLFPATKAEEIEKCINCFCRWAVYEGAGVATAGELREHSLISLPNCVTTTKGECFGSVNRPDQDLRFNSEQPTTCSFHLTQEKVLQHPAS